jgi:hypothetical protein
VSSHDEVEDVSEDEDTQEVDGTVVAEECQ